MVTGFEIALVAAGGVGGVAGGGALARYGARRTLTRPAGCDVAAERSVVAAVRAERSNYPTVAALEAEDFYDPAYRAWWEALAAAYGEVGDPAALDALVASDPEGDDLLERGRAEGLTGRRLVRVGARVLAAGEDRRLYGGRAAPRETGEREIPLARAYTDPPLARRTLVRGTLGVGAALGAALVGALGLGVAASTLATLAVWVIVAGGALIALVDHDTMYLDDQVYVVTAVGGWALAAAADLIAGDGGRLVAGLAVVAATAAVFEGANVLYERVRGRTGMGRGDSMILVLSAGVPSAVTGAWVVGVDGVVAGLALGVIGAVGMMVRGWLGRGPRFTRQTPFAFGPYLAAGWLVAWGLAWLANLPAVHP